MDIKNISSSQNFGAKHIATTKIKEKVPFLPIYKKINVDFVELEQTSDIPQIEAYVANNVYSVLGLKFLRNLHTRASANQYKAFAITRQQTGYEKLEPEKIIGICDGHFTCDWRDGNIFFIEHLETMSKNNRHRKPNQKTVSFLGLKFQVADKIKNVGKAILKNIITTLGEDIDSIKLEAMPTAKSFYRHLGFKNDDINPDYYRLPFNKFDNLMKMD